MEVVDRQASTPAGPAAPILDDVIRLESVSFRYRVPSERFTTFKEYAIRRVQGRVNMRDFWALRDIELSVARGEVLGIVGRNGAGKSTLLRLVSGVILPSVGRLRVKGWPVSPMLEIGAGFHPDLTGRENVYLNGTLLGHSKKEVEQRFASILDFSELHEVIDAPLRTYSSGMMARLGFSVATAWDPTVLLIDEVLAVGDEAFRRKCEARIEDFRRRLVTVLLVSHQLSQVKQICTRALWLDVGIVRAVGDPATVVDHYAAAAAE